MLEYKINNKNITKTSDILPVVEVTFSDMNELLYDEEENIQYEGDKKDKIMVTCECEDIDRLHDGSTINVVNNLILIFGNNPYVQQSYTFRNDYQISNVDEKEKSFNFFIDKYLLLDIDRIICGYENYKPSEFFEGHENDNIFLHCKSFHYFDITSNLNENDEQEIPIIFKYFNDYSEIVSKTINFRFYDYSTLTTSLSSFDDCPDLFKLLFNVEPSIDIEENGNTLTYYVVLPPKPTESSEFGWKRKEIEQDGVMYYTWIPMESEYDLDAMEEIQAIRGDFSSINIYRHTYLFGDNASYQFKVERTFAEISVPLTSTFDNNLLQTELLNEYFIEAEKNKVINRVADIEKDVYYPCIATDDLGVAKYEEFQDIYTIKFNLHFREHRTKDWIVDKDSFWNGVKQDFEYVKEIYNDGNPPDIPPSIDIDVIQQSDYDNKTDEEKKQYTKRPKEGSAVIDENVTSDDVSDLLTFINITNDDVYYQKNKLKKSFLRLSFYDSMNPGNQNMIGYSTIFIDSGKLFLKYAKHINTTNYGSIDFNNNYFGSYTLNLNKKGIRVNREYLNNMNKPTFEDEYRLSTQLVTSSKNTSTSSSDGFYLYIWKDNESTMPQDLFMKVEFNHAGYGRTIPFMMPFWDRKKWNNDNTKIGIKTFQEILNDWNDKKYVDEENGKVTWRDGTDGHYGIRQYNKYSYIHLKYQYDRENDKHYYFIDPETYGKQNRNDDNEIIINLYEAKVE